ncbi:MAG: hypothetical protein GY810_05600 [Aureispira sp.]|nr:hypothetical protein [Aureispira sp.]
MAIKNKVKAEQYGDDAKKPIAYPKVKQLAFSAIKDLKKKGEGAKTKFFVKKDHFKNTKGKVEGHFVAIGDSAALEKKFKKEKTSTEAAYGNVFVKNIAGKETVHFEYVSGQGKLKKPADWKAMIKTIKKVLKSDCVFVVDGQTVKEDAPKDENVAKSETKTNTSPEWKAQKAKIKDKMSHMKAQLEKLATKLNV